MLWRKCVCWIEPVGALYRDTDKVVSPTRKEENQYFGQKGVNFLRRLALQEEKKLDDGSRLDVVEMCDIVQGC